MHRMSLGGIIHFFKYLLKKIKSELHKVEVITIEYNHLAILHVRHSFWHHISQ